LIGNIRLENIQRGAFFFDLRLFQLWEQKHLTEKKPFSGSCTKKMSETNWIKIEIFATIFLTILVPWSFWGFKTALSSVPK
jgi:hypothetical protein